MWHGHVNTKGTVCQAGGLISAKALRGNMPGDEEEHRGRCAGHVREGREVGEVIDGRQMRGYRTWSFCRPENIGFDY